jgi:recombinational DNA repair protein (RecF pathway)
LKDLSFSRFVFVRGKNSWRLTDVFPIAVFSPKESPEKSRVVAALFSLVCRFVQGEEKNQALWNEIESGFTFLKTSEFSREEILLFETLFAWKVLAVLGYAGEDSSLLEFTARPFSKDALVDFAKKRRPATVEINRAIQESQL